MTLDYRLASRAAHPLAILWCAHPLFTIEDGMRIEVRHGTPIPQARHSEQSARASHGRYAAESTWAM